MGKTVAKEQKSTSNAGSGRKSGRTVFDESGQGIWEWQTATGVFERNVTEEQLRRLEAPDLALVEPMAAEGRVWSAPADLPKKPSHSASSRTPARPARQGSALSRFLRKITGLN